MKKLFRSTKPFIALLAGAILFSGSAARADDHVVPLSELRSAIAQASSERAADRSAIEHFFSQPRVRDTLNKAGINVENFQHQASLMSDQEQAQLASRVRAADQQISAGDLKDSQVTLIIMAVTLFAVLALFLTAFA